MKSKPNKDLDGKCTIYVKKVIDGFTNFGSKTPATPPQNEYLNPFENDMYDIIRKVKFIKVINDFQDKFKQDLETIRLSKNVLAFADKSTNLFELSKEIYVRRDTVTR